MTTGFSKLSSLRPILCQTADGVVTGIWPHPNLFDNIPILREVLVLIIDDWNRDTEPNQRAIDQAPIEDVYHRLRVMVELRARFAKCLFSYALFFEALCKTYGEFYSDLNHLNRQQGLRLKHAKRPQQGPDLDRIKIIRNVGIAHPLDPDQGVDELTAEAASFWHPTLANPIGERPQVADLIFGGFRLNRHDAKGEVIEQSSDIEVRIPEMHTRCMAYLDEYDQTCADYLNAIIERLPLTVDNMVYKYSSASATRH